MAETDANKPIKKNDKQKPAEPKTVAEAKQLEKVPDYWQLTDDEVLLRSPSPEDEFKTSDSWRVFRILGEFVGGFDDLATITRGVSIFGSARTHPDDPMSTTPSPRPIGPPRPSPWRSNVALHSP